MTYATKNQMGNHTMQLMRRPAAAAVLATFAIAACSGSEATTDKPEEAVVALAPADVASAQHAPVASGVAVTGSLQPQWIVSIKAQVPGTITNIRVDRGVRVSQGQVLASVQAEGIRGQAEGARAAVAAAEANLAVAEQRLESARTLRQAGAMSQLDFRAAEAAYESARAQLAAARAQAAGAIEQAQRATITAPIAGVIGSRAVQDGEAVNPGQELFTVVRSDVLELSGQVPVDAATSIRTGQPVVFTLNAYPGREFRGQVARIEPMADPATRQVGVYMQMRNPGGLIGGQFATGRILSEQSDSGLVVPQTAIRREGSNTFVYGINGDRVVRKPVTVGTVDATSGMIQILAGLNAGDRVISAPAAVIEENTRVQVVQPAAEPATSAEERK